MRSILIRPVGVRGLDRHPFDGALAIIDVCLVSASWVAALLLRFDGRVPVERWEGFWGFLPWALGLTLLTNGMAGLYAGVWMHASIFEARRVVTAQIVTAATIVLFLATSVERPVPLAVPIVAAFISTGLVGAVRFHSRLFAVRRHQVSDGGRTLVIGAGSAGAALVKDVAERRRDVRIVGFLDDDPRLHGRRVQGVTVHGPIASLGGVVDSVNASCVVLAIPSAHPALVRHIASLAEGAGVALRVVPPLSDLVNGEVHLTDVRDIEISDLLGRHQVETELDDVKELLRGRRVLITGGGGSIGSEIARQVAATGAARVVLLDHDETHLFEAAASVPTAVQVLSDIRDRAALDRVFRLERPEVVFHAAAHKHVPLLEDHAVEAVETNILGTRHVIDSSRRWGVTRFVLISTDKAVNPSSVMGASKAVAEQVVLAPSSGLKTCAVRFGNVLGSRGSVVPTFAQQIREGGPVTVTDARMTRYFMSIPEAVRLVLHAAALAQGGEVFMLDMGEPVRIIDLAARMIRLSGRRPGHDIEVRVTGIRPGEKLTEELHCRHEVQHPTSHPAILRLSPRRVPPQVLSRHLTLLAAAAADRDDPRARSLLFSLSSATLQTPRVPQQVNRGATAWT